MGLTSHGAAAETDPADEVLRAIAEPRRREILRLVATGEMAAGEIAATFDVSRTAISQHLTVLRNAGLVTERREGTRRLYRARPEGLAGLREFLDVMWASSLDIAVRLAEAGHEDSDDGQVPAAGLGGRIRRQGGRMGEVTALRRPPVRQSALVRAGRQHTFDTFVDTIGRWWPVNPFSAGKDRVRTVSVDKRVGGRVYETWDDGTKADWGEVLVWSPPERFAMTWAIVSVLTEVELTFTELGPALTRVSVVHSGWEKLSDEQLADDCALPGGYLGGAFDTGWATILSRLASAAEETVHVTPEGDSR